MRALAFDLLETRVPRGSGLLDVGCGTGGVLAAARARGYGPLAGLDPVDEAVTAARLQVPTADLRRASASQIPFDDASFPAVMCFDVLQHVEREELARSVSELRRVVTPRGAIVVRTNGAPHHREERSDWRCFEPVTLRALLERAGLRCVRISYANALGSMIARMRGQEPRAPTLTGDGVPSAQGGRGSARYGVLRVESTLIVRTALRIPYGHSLVALAVRD